MSGTATLNHDILVDDLVEDIDELRADLNGSFGVRAFRCYSVLRSWAGQQVGEDDYTDVVTEITPQPRVRQWDGYKWVLLAAGVHEDGVIRLTEVSLTYTFAELAPPDTLRPNLQFFYVLVDAYGQSNDPRVLRVAKPPFPDREKDIGWVLDLMDMNLEVGQFPVIPGGA